MARWSAPVSSLTTRARSAPNVEGARIGRGKRGAREIERRAGRVFKIERTQVVDDQCPLLELACSRGQTLANFGQLCVESQEETRFGHRQVSRDHAPTPF